MWLGMAHRGTRELELRDNLSATRSLLSEAVRHLDAASPPTQSGQHGSSVLHTTAARSNPPLNSGDSHSLASRESHNVEVQREIEIGRGFNRSTSFTYPYRPFVSGSLKRRGVRSNFPAQSKKKKVAMWEKEFICLAYVDQKRCPTPLHKCELIRAGLGVAKLSFFQNSNALEFHEELIEKFPKLRGGGGYELLRSVGSSHELEVIPSPSGGYTASYVKNVVNQAKVYVRPLQKDLCLDEILTEDDVVSAVDISKNN